MPRCQMINVDDAMKVLIQDDLLDHGYSGDDGTYEYVRNELEQQSYSFRAIDWEKSDLESLINAINPIDIAQNIGEGRLKSWCENLRNNIMAVFELCLKDKEENSDE